MAARRRSPARLVIALSVAAMLAVFLLYTSFAGGATPSLRPSQLDGHTGEVSLAGEVVRFTGSGRSERGLRFTLRDIDGKATVPDLFEKGRHVYLRGQLRNGVFMGEKDSLVTKCPSKYEPKNEASA